MAKGAGGFKMPTIEFIKKDPKSGRITLLLKDCDVSIANFLRRAVMDEVPTMAIDEVEFRKNDSVLYDEIIAHRLGLLPLKTDLKSYTVRANCKCGGKGCERCTLILSLKAKGPTTVYAEELKSEDPKVKPVFPRTPLVKLHKGQELELEATAVLGTGAEHVKWSPCLAWYEYKPKVTVNNSHPKLAEFKNKYPPQIFKDNKIDTKLIEELNLYDAVDGVNDEIIKVERDQRNFIFYLEPWGQLSPKEILISAIERYEQKMDEFEEKLSAAKGVEARAGVAEPG
ncbi:MAG: DNA-directed RNA polymerase subunit D, partial [Candidatus Woesearchaeota archaeon]